MKICIFIPQLDIFKGGNHLPLFEALKEVSFTVLTTSTRPDEAPLPPNVNVKKLGGNSNSYYGGFSDALYAKKVLKNFPPSHNFWKSFDILHFNQTMGPDLMKLKQTQKPLLLTIHHPVTADLQVALEETRFLQKLKWKLKYQRLVRFQKNFVNQCPHIMVVSETVASRVISDYGCEKNKIHIVYNGVDGNKFPDATDLNPNYDVIAVGSLIHPRKGFKYLVEAYQQLTQMGYRIADVGRRQGEQQELLKTIKGVTTFGMVEEDQLISLMRHSQALISTSLYEGFGLSLIEALSCGRPAFAFSGGAVAEVLNPIDTLLHVPLRDVARLVQAVSEFLERSSAEKIRLGQDYRKSVLQRYSISKSAQNLKSLYEKIVESKS